MILLETLEETAPAGMTMQRISLSIIIPAYNEECNIREAIRAVNDGIPGCLNDFEIIVVDDGSSDSTGTLLAEIAQENCNFSVITHDRNRGKGAALISGFNKAEKDWLLFLDADLQIAMSELSAFLPYVDRFDCVFGYRSGRTDSFARILFSKMFAFLVFIAIGVRLCDLNCPFKLFRRSLLNDVELRSNGFFIDVELLHALQHKGSRIKELPVSGNSRRHGKSTVRFRHVVETVREMIALKKRVV